MPDTAAILSSLPKLSAQDLRSIADRCAVLLKLSGGGKLLRSDPQHDSFSATLYDAISDELQKRTQLASKPYTVFLRTGSGKHFEQAAMLVEQAHQRWYQAVSALQLISACRLYAELLLDYHASRSLPATWPILAHTVESLPAIVEESFPGYAQNGMLEWVQQLRSKGGAVSTA